MWRLIAPPVPLVLALDVEEAAAIERAMSVSLRRPHWREYASHNPILSRAVLGPMKAWARRRIPCLSAPAAGVSLLVLLVLAADSAGLRGPGFG
jgi:hypothetical protein